MQVSIHTHPQTTPMRVCCTLAPGVLHVVPCRCAFKWLRGTQERLHHSRNNSSKWSVHTLFRLLLVVVAVEVTCDKTKVYVSAEAPFSKRYLKVPQPILGQLNEHCAATPLCCVEQPPHTHQSPSPPLSPQQYLTKKYLKKFQLRDYLHVIASDRDRQAYEVNTHTHTHTGPGL